MLPPEAWRVGSARPISRDDGFGPTEVCTTLPLRMAALQAGSQIGSYVILAPIGAGRMGEVYRSRDTKQKRDVAIKVLPAEFSRDPERLRRFRREAELLATLNQPHVAQILRPSKSCLCHDH